MSERDNMKKIILVNASLILLSSCTGFEKFSDIYADTFDSFEIDDLLTSQEKYTNIKLMTGSPSYSARVFGYYSIIINGSPINVGIDIKSNHSYMCSLNGLYVYGDVRPNNNNCIYTSDNNLMYFGGNYLNVIDAENNIIYQKLIFNNAERQSNFTYYDHSGIVEKGSCYYLYSIGYDSFDLAIIDKETYEVKETENLCEIDIDKNSNLFSYDFEMPTVLNETTYIFSNRLFIINDLNILYDDFNVLSKPELVNGNYVYKAICERDNVYIYDPEHTIGVESDKSVAIPKGSNDEFIQGYIKENGEINLFVDELPLASAISATRYLKISSDDEIKYKYFASPSLYLGYALHDGEYYHEILNDRYDYAYEGKEVDYLHFKV